MSLRLIIVALLLLGVGTAQAGCPRIVSQAPYITKSLQWLGLQPCIVGVSRYDTLDLPRTGGVLDPDAEALDVLQPQLMFNADWLDAKKWQSLAPKGAQAITLHGFESMAQVEENLRVIGHAANQADTDMRVAGFARQWRAEAARVHGNRRRVLLLSACSGMPYSFGHDSWLYDLFTQAGFDVVENETKLRHLRPGETIADIGMLADTLRADVLFVFERKAAQQCQLIRPKRPLRIVTLDGDHFLHPAPVLLEGLAELREKRSQWSVADAASLQ